MTRKKRIFLSPPHMGGEELRLVKEAFASNYIAPLGPMVDAFEREFADYTGIPHCAAVSSGTAAMHLALRHLGVGPGDEVFASTLTFIGSVTPVIFQGATPVFIDSDRATWNMDPALLEDELERCGKEGRLPRAVIPTDLYGQCCDYERILAVCERHRVPVVLDAAEALGAKYSGANPGSGVLHSNSGKDAGPAEPPHSQPSTGDTPQLKTQHSKLPSPPPTQNSTFRTQNSKLSRHAGKGARAAVFSFNGNKIITTSGGGMLASEDKELIDRARFLSQQAKDPFPHYEHTEIGYNYRMSNIVAAIGRGQLRVLDERVGKKRWIFDHYRQALDDLPGIELMPEAPYGRSTRWLTVVLITPEEFGADREQVRLALEAENIESRPVWKPMHLQPVFDLATDPHRRTPTTGAGDGRSRRHAARVVGGSVAEDLFERGLCLPSGTAMMEEDLERVIRVIRRCRK